MIETDPYATAAQLSADPPEGPLRPGIALSLSGGGYRAMLFHLGTLWRLNDAGYLPKLSRVSSVSGGSITAGMLGLAWPRLAFDERGVAARFTQEVVAPITGLAGRTIDVWAALRGLFGPGTSNDVVIRAYRTHLYGDHTLQDLPDENAGPRFVINATNLQSGNLMRFSRPYAWDYRVGEIAQPKIPLAVAVAASSAFPPFLSPAVLNLTDAQFAPGTGKDLQYPPYTTAMQLTDGGVYDNLGLETTWKDFRTVLVSDGGGKMQEDPTPARDWLRALLRVHDITDNQVRAVRKRQVIASYRLPPADPDYRAGTYWGIWSHVADYGLSDPLPCPPNETLQLARTPTRLGRLDQITQQRLINWGFAICDAGMRRWVDPSLPRPADFPYPDAKVG